MKFKGNEGITLIALVVTIIILIILSAIGIQIITNEKGIVNRAKYAKEETIEQQLLEELRFKIADIQIEKKGFTTLKEIVEILKNDTMNDYKISDEIGILKDEIPNIANLEKNIYCIKNIGLN